MFKKRRVLANVNFLSLKALLATGLALGLDLLLNNPDHVSSTFVALLCISPTVLMGLRRGTAQFTGSIIGGLIGTALAYLGLPLIIALPIAVGLAVFMSIHTGQILGYTVAGFTALFVLAVPQGTPIETFQIRILAIFIGSFSGFIVNVFVSSFDYIRIFERKIKVTEDYICDLILKSSKQGPSVMSQAFTFVSVVQQELSMAKEEVILRKSQSILKKIRKMDNRLYNLIHLVHLFIDMDYIQKEKNIPTEDTEDFFIWIYNTSKEKKAIKSNEIPKIDSNYQELKEKIVNVLKILI